VSLLARAVAATAAGGRKSGGCQGHHLLWRESRAVIDSVVIDGDPVALDDLPCAEAMECQFNVGSGDGGENQWGQSAPGRSTRKPASYNLYEAARQAIRRSHDRDTCSHPSRTKSFELSEDGLIGGVYALHRFRELGFFLPGSVGLGIRMGFAAGRGPRQTHLCSGDFPG